MGNSTYRGTVRWRTCVEAADGPRRPDRSTSKLGPGMRHVKIATVARRIGPLHVVFTVAFFLIAVLYESSPSMRSLVRPLEIDGPPHPRTRRHYSGAVRFQLRVFQDRCKLYLHQDPPAVKQLILTAFPPGKPVTRHLGLAASRSPQSMSSLTHARPPLSRTRSTAELMHPDRVPRLRSSSHPAPLAFATARSVSSPFEPV